MQLMTSVQSYLNQSYVFSSASNRIIAAKDHASIQINIAEVWQQTLLVVNLLVINVVNHEL